MPPLDGGGGKSTGSTANGSIFTLSGTIGQFDATSLAPAGGGTFTLNGGYRAQALASDLPDQPRLIIVPQPGGSASIQWQADAAGWQMETSTNLADWSPFGGPITTAGALTMTPTPGTSKQFSA